MKRSYLGAVSTNGASFGIVFRDFPGCVSVGDTLDDVLAMGAEALQGHAEAMTDCGELLPSPSQHDLADVLHWLDEENDPSGDEWLGLYPVAITIAETPLAVSVPVEADIVHQIAAVVESNLSALSARQFIEDATRRELARLRKSA